MLVTRANMLKLVIVICALFFRLISVSSKSLFLLSIPKVLQSGKNETVCLSLHHEPTLPASLVIDLLWKDKHYANTETINSTFSCFDIKIPLTKLIEPQYVSMKVHMKFNKTSVYSAHNLDPILMYPNENEKIFIEMSQYVYKPGDTVKFMVIGLNQKFLPMDKQISEIRIKNPIGITTMLWQSLRLNHGLVNLEYQTPDESMTGKWTLEVENRVRHQFEIAKYVLPHFRININYPKIVYYKAESISIYVCARYIYNKPVIGIAFIKISHVDIELVSQFQELMNGCATFKFNGTELSLDRINDQINDGQTSVQITATITEQGTNKIDVSTVKSRIVSKAYSLKFIGNSIFVPGLSYRGTVKLINIIDGNSIEGEFIEICYVLAIKKSWNLFNNEQCENFTITDSHAINFQLFPLKTNVLHVRLKAKSISNPSIQEEHLLVRLYSAHLNFITVEKLSFSNVPCSTQLQYKIAFPVDRFRENETVAFYFMFKSSKGIFKMYRHTHVINKVKANLQSNSTVHYLGHRHKFVKMDSTLNEFIKIFTITEKFINKFSIIIYYLSKEGEMVATTIKEEIQPCVRNITAYWEQNPILPGNLATLYVKSENSGLCAVSVVDKSTKLMGESRTLNSFRILKELFYKEKEAARSERNTCVFNKKSNLPKREKRHTYSFAEDFDAYDVFSKFGIITITNLDLVTKPCYTGPVVNDSYQQNYPQFLTDHYITANEDVAHVLIRSHFPETWLWELVPINDTVHLQRTTPHSITNWTTNVFCLSGSEGLSIAAETDLTTFQAFFVNVLTPFSLKKDENFNLVVQVFNYLDYSLPIKISIRLSDNLQLMRQTSATYCLKPNDTQVHNYAILALKTGTANVTVLVESDDQYPFTCGPETIISKRDVVFKSFKVEPEGYFLSITNSALLCASENINHKYQNNITWKVRIPNDHVEDTEKVSVTFNTDILGHSIENLDQLLSIPTGCGEQIMASMAPNLYVLKYLNATNALSSSQRQRIVRNLKLGYQKILNYLHSDGSFSAFGYYDPTGSMFLTTFVVKILQESKQLIYVDDRIIRNAVQWIFKHQLENGCFETMHHVFQDMGGTDWENSTAGLTAYVILSLFDAEIDVPDSVQTNAKYCIRSQNNPDKFSMAISSYALYKVHWISEAQRFLGMTIRASNSKDGLMWWTAKESDSDSDNSASDIEITAYVLLALLEQKTGENLSIAHSIVQWLASKMSPTGGFQSTQDTVVALDALTCYVQFLKPKTHLDLNIKLETDSENYSFNLNEKGQNTRYFYLKNENSQLTIVLEGSGCVLTQLTLSYFTTMISESEAFTLDVGASVMENHSIQSIEPCVTYEGPNTMSNMAVMEFVLPSGYKSDRKSLYELVEANKSIKMFEEKDGQINIYFTNLSKKRVCFSFKIREELEIDNRKDGFVKLYEYYRSDQGILKFYNLNSKKKFRDYVLADVVDCNQLYQEKRRIYKKDLNARPLETLDFQTPECITISKNVNSRVKREDKSRNVLDSTDNCVNLSSHNVNGNSKDLKDTRQGRLILLKYKTDTIQVNKDLESQDMETPNCVNIPFYVPYNISFKQRVELQDKYLSQH